MERLNGKVAIITGAAGGLCGKASEFFCREGARVVMVDMDPKVKDDCAAIVAAGGDAIALEYDVSVRENWDKLLSATIEKYGTVDIMVNGAAEFSKNGDWDSGETEEHFDLVMKTNLKSLLYSYQTVLRYMADHGIRGNFLNFSSSTALGYFNTGFQAYPLSKAAILLGTRDMVKKFGANGIRFNCLALQCVWTPKTAALFESPKYSAWFNSVIPLGFVGQPEDAAWAMVYLCSDEAKFIDGVCLSVDGGWDAARS